MSKICIYADDDCLVGNILLCNSSLLIKVNVDCTTQVEKWVSNVTPENLHTNII